MRGNVNRISDLTVHRKQKQLVHMTNRERSAYYLGAAHAYRDVFEAFEHAISQDLDIPDLFDLVVAKFSETGKAIP